MKIGFFTDSYFPQVNGVTYTLESWKKKLEQRGHTVYIYYPSAEYEPKKREYPFKSVGVWFYPGYRLAVPFNVGKKTKELDVVHEHGLYTMAWAGLWAAKANGIPKVLSFHTPGDEYLDYLPLSSLCKPLYRGIYMGYERMLLNSFDHVTTGSPVIRDRLSENGVKDVEVLSNGIELDLFHEVDPRGFRERNGISSEKVIGFCGRLGYEKHLEDLIAAADGFDGQVLIAGSGPAERHYRALAKEKENVQFLGFIDHMKLRQFYSALDVFVFPSFCETQGLVALESMACATPVVGVPVLALKSTIEDKVTGYHYSPGDRDDLLEKIRLCYDNMEELKKNCLRQAKDNSMDKVVDRLVEIYEEV